MKNTIPQHYNPKFHDGMPPFNQSVGKYNFYAVGHQHQSPTIHSDIELPAIGRKS